VRTRHTQTERSWLLLYDLHTTKQLVLPPSTLSAQYSPQDSAQQQQLHVVDVYVKHTARCGHAVPATRLACDSRAVLVAFADGLLGACSWSGKVRVLPCAAVEAQVDACMPQPRMAALALTWA
jgi:hypothetical protein